MHINNSHGIYICFPLPAHKTINSLLYRNWPIPPGQMSSCIPLSFIFIQKHFPRPLFSYGSSPVQQRILSHGVGFGFRKHHLTSDSTAGTVRLLISQEPYPILQSSMCVRWSKETSPKAAQRMTRKKNIVSVQSRKHRTLIKGFIFISFILSSLICQEQKRTKKKKIKTLGG